MSSRAAPTVQYRLWSLPSAAGGSVSAEPPPLQCRRQLTPPPPFLTAASSDSSDSGDDLSQRSREDSQLTSTGSSSSSSPPSSTPSSPYERRRENSLPEDLSLHFFPFLSPLLTQDADARSLAIASIRDSIASALAAFTAAKAASTSPSSPPLPPPALVVGHFPSLLRLALEAPLTDVRIGLIEILAMIADADERFANVLPAASGACRLIPDHLLPSADEPDDATPPTSPPVLRAAASTVTADDEPDAPVPYLRACDLLLDLFAATGRIGHFDRLLAFQPTFYSFFTATLDFLMTDAGPLPVPDRLYIAIIAASRLPSPYFISLLSSHFLQSQGEASWLQSIAHTPKRMQAFSSLSSLLCYTPYSLQAQHIERCLKEGGMSMSELVQALCILTTYHATAAFAAALQINEEVDLGPLVQRVKDTPSSSRPSSRRNSTAAAGDEASAPSAASVAAAANVGEGKVVAATRRDSKGEIVTEAQFLRRVLSDGHLQAEEGPMQLSDDADIQPQIFPEAADRPIDQLYCAAPAAPQPQPAQQQRETAATPAAAASCIPASSHRFFAHPSELNIAPAAFVPSRDHPLFSFSSFSFKEHAAVTLERHYPSFSSLFLAELEHASALTTGHIGPYVAGSLPIDTWPLRRAIAMFVHRYLGVYYDDFQYANISLLLNAPLQLFLCRVCEGQPMRPEEWALAGYELTEGEKVHIALLVMEARRQAALLYSMHAVVQHLDRHHA